MHTHVHTYTHTCTHTRHTRSGRDHADQLDVDADRERVVEHFVLLVNQNGENDAEHDPRSGDGGGCGGGGGSGGGGGGGGC